MISDKLLKWWALSKIYLSLSSCLITSLVNIVHISGNVILFINFLNIYRLYRTHLRQQTRYCSAVKVWQTPKVRPRLGTQNFSPLSCFGRNCTPSSRAFLSEERPVELHCRFEEISITRPPTPLPGLLYPQSHSILDGFVKLIKHTFTFYRSEER